MGRSAAVFDGRFRSARSHSDVLTFQPTEKTFRFLFERLDRLAAIDDGTVSARAAWPLQLAVARLPRDAFLFQDQAEADSDIQEQLTIVELDPNKDRDFSDARVKTTIPIGASQVEGHHGHHAIPFDAYGRRAIFTEPGTAF